MSSQMLIQSLLLLAMLGVMLYFVANRRKARAKAGVKIGFVVFVAACVWAVLRPDDLTVVANWVGVARGTDLLLYLVTMAFVFVTVSAYIRFRELELRYARLARAVALSNAVPPDTSGDEPVVHNGEHD
ncbi:DUF2304 domain-containing protein [Corynebacterium sp. TAE3-ERU12]|uniref:DUF2304 domain-containing protein n=1 Tax=Corynebacterium sp. TAE3-ERU12 TaxID=2849491 RepID=UPI001C493A0A|nr:DUF2304 domain-containing protein [Corynebacterium sp. TAE3-ERU12]MBV7294502.1 DUF2304 domain-containing protein [Corynebacterium sp. TAE3-ERU12]